METSLSAVMTVPAQDARDAAKPFLPYERVNFLYKTSKTALNQSAPAHLFRQRPCWHAASYLACPDAPSHIFSKREQRLHQDSSVRATCRGHSRIPTGSEP